MAAGSTDVQALTGTEQLWRWNVGGPLGTPVAVTYSFATRAPKYETSYMNGLVAFDGSHKQHIRAALDVWAAASGLTFIEVPETAGAGGQMRFSMVDFSGDTIAGGGQVAGRASYPGISWSWIGDEPAIYSPVYDSSGGDVWLHKGFYGSDGSTLAPGTDGFRVLLHEIGHAIGFKHPHDDTPNLPASRDNLAHTVMTYNVGDGTTSTLGSIDIEAVQLYYGKTSFRTVFDPGRLTLEITGTRASQTVLGTELADALHGLAGRDVLVGGPKNDRLFGGGGNDTLRGDDGNDLLVGGPGKDRLIGGEGIDTASYADAGKRVAVRLDNPKANVGEARGDSYDSIEKLVGSRFADRIDGMTWQQNDIAGGAGKDVLNGGRLNDRLRGEAGDDTLTGGDGNDTLAGGNGRDTLIGGHGKDVLTGGKGADRFVFKTISDLQLSRSLQDVIRDFRQAQNDKIVLKAIDANIWARKNNAFSFIEDTGFSGSAGELRYQKNKGATLVYGDIDGDGRADFAIRLAGAITLTGDDFVL